ncbi:Hypothetical predicted protein [Mytilus galloprovincialis]|uniref:Uncharacterized protein n=1 Tax=Mytilus galloprovincialis TaxID=29158 RepID=A0A8B6HQI0_MYTGA|nr:Hypothetical predicted protein [Mytilus galloprovincialis]
MWSTSAKKTFLRSNIDGDSGVNRSIEGPVATTLHSSEVMSMTMAPVFTTATSSSADDNQIRALYIPGSSNAGADSLSRFRVIRSRPLGPEAFIIPDIPNMNFHMVISKLE